MSMEKCQRCGDEGYDRRTLWMSCFYLMSELGLPFEEAEKDGLRFYTLLVCKDCRGDWMAMIKLWFEDVPKNKIGCGSGIFVRREGRNVEITEDEWHRLNPGRKPVRVRP